jgi:predicted enzyme related to lactoylglutathione lyase
MIKTGEQGEPGIDGAIMKKQDPKQPVVNAIDVENINETSKKKAGGKIVLPKAAVPAIGGFCYFKDLDGNIHGLWQTDKNAKAI